MGSQLTLEGGRSGGDLYTTIEHGGFALLEQNIPGDVIDEMSSEHAAFTDNFPNPEPITMNAMIVDPGDLDKLDYAADTQAEWHKVRTNTPHFAKPNGYTNRAFQAEVLQELRGLDVHEDPKEYFHYTPGMIERVKKRHEDYEWGPIPKEALALMQKMHAVHYLAKKAMSQFFGEIEEIHPEINKIITPADLDISPVRGLYYLEGQGETLAGGHYDRGIFTLQVAESHIGFRGENPQTGEMTLVDRDPEYGVLFPAYKWQEAFPDSPLEALWHDVINDPTANKGRNLYGEHIVRSSIIYFVNSRSVGEHAVKLATHTQKSAPLPVAS